MINDDMPSYVQYPNACGLTSLLMALKPESRNMAPLLNKIWNKIKTLFYMKGNSVNTAYYYNWQRVLEYLLFQVVKNDDLQKMLKKNFGNILNDAIIPIIIYGINQERSHKKNKIINNPSFNKKSFKQAKIKNQALMDRNSKQNAEIKNNTKEIIKIEDEKVDHNPGYKKNYKINGNWIMRRVNVWKKDIELEILANLFGCTFIPWEKTEDGTGAIFFDYSDFNNLSQENSLNSNNDFDKKIEFLIQKVNSGGPVICCAGYHWLAIKEIFKLGNKYFVKYHDPASGHEFSRSLNRFHDVDRFYSFSFSEPDRKEREQILNQILF